MPNENLRKRLERARQLALEAGDRQRQRLLEQALALEVEITDLLESLAENIQSGD